MRRGLDSVPSTVVSVARVAVIASAVLFAAACGPDSSGAAGSGAPGAAPPTAAGATSAPAQAAGGSGGGNSGGGNGGGDFCALWNENKKPLTDKLFDAPKETDPVKLRKDVEDIQGIYETKAGAAPASVRADYQVFLDTWKANHDQIAAAGWTPISFVRAIGGNAKDDRYVQAGFRILAALHDQCGFDPVTGT